MNHNKKNIIFFSIIVALCLCVSVVVYMHIGSGTKEIKAARKFIENMHDYNLVDIDEDDKVNFKSITKSDSLGDKEYYSIETKSFRIDVDSDYNVIGFSNNTSKTGEIEISEDKAMELGEQYLKYLYKGDCEFQEFIKETSETNNPYYTLIFTKIYDGYPFYNDKIMIGIDKTNGKVDSYANSTFQGKPEKIKIKKSEEDAIKVAMDSFSKMNSDGIVLDGTYKAFCDNKESKETELCYIITIEGKDLEENEIKMKYFVSTETGELINFSKDKITETVLN